MRSVLVLATFVALSLSCTVYNLTSFYYYTATHANVMPSDSCPGSSCLTIYECDSTNCTAAPSRDQANIWYNYYLTYGDLPADAYLGTCATAPTPKPPTPKPSGSSSNTWTIIGIVAGVIAGLGIIGGVAYYLI